jgi:uncharacterized peroxidase-related enzyme
MQHHGEALRATGVEAALVEALARDPAGASLDQRSRALVDYALKLTKTPDSVGETDVAALRSRGLADAAIHDAACVVAYFNFVNRIALGLGVELEA